MAERIPDPKVVELDAIVKAAIENDQVPKIYANSFGLGLTNADIFIIFQRFGTRPVGVVNLSYTLAKTLAQRLGAIVSEFEATIGGQAILTTDRIDEALKSKSEASKSVKGKSDDVH